MLTKINIKKIVIDHFKTLRDANSERISISDLALFFIIPFAASTAIVFYFGILLSDNLINILITSLSIFVGLLLNLLVIIFDVVTKLKENGNQETLKKKFLKEIYSNISFSILLSIVAILFLVLSLTDNCYFKSVTNVITDALLLFFGITLLMILRRVHILLSNEF